MIDQNNIYPNMSMKAHSSQDIGQGRMLVDNVADPDECQELIHLAEVMITFIFLTLENKIYFIIFFYQITR